MIGVMNLASYGFFQGGTFGNLLAQWEMMGVFSYVLPFLLLFALTFGILSKINIFTMQTATGVQPNKSINAILALGVSLMALQFDFVPRFFSEIFPRLGVALAVLLVILILGGLFMPVNVKGFNWGLIAIVFIMIIVVVTQSLGSVGWYSGSYWLQNYFWNIVGILAIVVVLVVIVGAGSSKTTPEPDNILIRALGGGLPK